MGGGAHEPHSLRDASVVPLFTDRLVCIGHEADRDLKEGLTAERYLARPHAGFFLDFDVNASLEQFYLAESGILQFDRMLTSIFSALGSIVANSDCLALVPESLARITMAHLPIRYVDAPLELPPLELVMVFHRRREADEGMMWFVNALKSSAAQLAL